jgi:hypothetical protein
MNRMWYLSRNGQIFGPVSERMQKKVMDARGPEGRNANGQISSVIAAAIFNAGG